MKSRLKVIKIGNSLGVILPKDVLADLQGKEGNMLSLAGTAGGITLQSANPELEAQTGIVREVMRRRRNALRELAKS